MQAPGASGPPLAREGVDRAADERGRETLLDDCFADAGTRVLVLAAGRAPVRAGTAPHLIFVSPAAVTRSGREAFLGRDRDGAALVLVSVDDEPFEASGGWSELRQVGAELDAHDSGLFVEALSLDRWLRDASFCPACGARAIVRQAGWSRTCPSCGREHFPRTDPAVIVAVTDPAGERILLGANAAWGGDRYSCFAGFIEAGESAETAVAREIAEEAGVTLDDLRYLGSQAWPYPRSLMLGFIAVAVDPAAARADEEEIVAVRWFTRDELAEPLAGRGEITLPGPSSIARTLIESWYASDGA